MSDYSFMKSGFSATELPEETISETDILALISLFVENAMKTASRHVFICKRNGITQTDIIYGLIYEVFNWLKRPTLLKDFHEIRDEIENDEEIDEENSDYENIEDMVVPDDQIEEFKRADIQDDGNKTFLVNLYNYYDNWSSWVPQNSIENSLKSAIDKIIKDF